MHTDNVMLGNIEQLALTQHAGERRRMLILLFLGAMIVAADKAIFAFSGVAIMGELQLSATQFGMLGSAFFMFYSISGVAVGFLANRLATRWILLGLALIWAICQTGVALSSSLGVLLILRLLLGIGAGPSTAVIQHSCFKWYEPHERAMPASIINSGIMTGILISALTLPWLISHYGWRSAYLVLAGVSLSWAALWWSLGREGKLPANPSTNTHAVDPFPLRSNRYRDLLLNRSFIGTTSLCFVGYLVSGLGFSWHPTYLQKGLGLSTMQSGVAVMCVMSLVIIFVLAISALSQRWIRQGASARVALVWLPVGCCTVGGLALCAMELHTLPLTAKLILSGLGFILLNVQQNFGVVVCGDICPPGQRGAVLAIHIALTTSAGFVAPLLAGLLVERADNVIGIGYENCLLVIGLLTLAVAAACWRWVDPEQTRQQLASIALAEKS